MITDPVIWVLAILICLGVLVFILTVTYVCTESEKTTLWVVLLSASLMYAFWPSILKLVDAFASYL
jgi:hypothetical protein